MATRYFLERFDQDVTLDLAKTSTTFRRARPTTGTTTVNVVVGNYSLGTYPLTVDDPPAGPYTVGLFFDTRTETLPPAIEGNDGPIAGQNIRLLESFVSVLTSQRFAQNGTELAAYQVTDDLSAAPPLRTGRNGSSTWAGRAIRRWSSRNPIRCRSRSWRSKPRWHFRCRAWKSRLRLLPSAQLTRLWHVMSAGAQEKGKQASLMAAQEQSNAQNFEAGQYDIQGKAHPQRGGGG
jgi:hypothetical protein